MILLARGAISAIGTPPARLRVEVTAAGDGLFKKGDDHEINAADHRTAIRYFLDWLEQQSGDLHFAAAGHRVVHGGNAFREPVRIDDTVMASLHRLIPLAPLHQPFALYAIDALRMHRPELPQVACFDTAFHAAMPWQEQRFAIPVALHEQGIRRYGFHGLSYDHVCSVLPEYLAASANGRIVIAHLGQGASMCAVSNRQSVATTMSFTPLDGLPMGTRSGALDPAVVLYLVQNGMSWAQVSDLLHHQSGLLGLSGESGDMRTLLASKSDEASRAVDFFCYRISRELGSLAAALGGLDAVVFTGGIGEHAAIVREKICSSAIWLGIALDTEANRHHATHISKQDSRVSVWVIPTDEEAVIARQTAMALKDY